MAKQALVDVAGIEAEDVERHGVNVRELLDLRENRDFLSPTALERWLVAERLAGPNGAPGSLVPTKRALEIAELLDFVG